MRKIAMAAAGVVLAMSATYMNGQDLEDLNIQIHGYATQGFLYSSANNWSSVDTSSGSPGWSEAVVNVTARPDPRLRIGAQGRYFLLGNYGNTVSLDWANGDFKLNDRLGFQVGKVKTPEGMFNLTQDIDPALLWSVLPQGIYPVATRTSILTHLGGVVYGAFSLQKAGSVDYQGWAGERIIANNDPMLAPLAANEIAFPGGMYGHTNGGTLRWHTPLKGLMLGASDSSNANNGSTTLAGHFSGATAPYSFAIPFYFGQYEHKRLTLTSEYMRLPVAYKLNYTNGPFLDIELDFRSWYGMASYKLTDKLSVGSYFMSSFNLKDPLGADRYQKDWVASARYDVSPWVYLKGEEHFSQGTGGLAAPFTASAPGKALDTDVKMMVLKAGVSF